MPLSFQPVQFLWAKKIVCIYSFCTNGINPDVGVMRGISFVLFSLIFGLCCCHQTYTYVFTHGHGLHMYKPVTNLVISDLNWISVGCGHGAMTTWYSSRLKPQLVEQLRHSAIHTQRNTHTGQFIIWKNVQIAACHCMKEYSVANTGGLGIALMYNIRHCSVAYYILYSG